MRISDWSSDVCSSDLADTRHDITAHGADGEYRIEHDDSTTVVAGARLAGSHLAETGLSARFDARGRRYRIDADARRILLPDGERRWRYERVPAYQAAHAGAGGSGNQRAEPILGRSVLVRVAGGARRGHGRE